MSHDRETAARSLIDAWTGQQTPPPGVADRMWSTIQARAAQGDLGPELASAGASKASTGWTLQVVLGGALGILGIGAIAGLIVKNASDDPEPALVVATELAIEPTRPVEPIPSATPSLPSPTQPTVIVEPTSLLESEPTRDHARSRRPRPIEPEPKIATDTLAAEMALLASARKALKAGDTDEALEQLGKHAKQFPAGALASERELSRVTALCQADREAEAVKVARAYAAKHSNSPLAKRADAPCGGLSPD